MSDEHDDPATRPAEAEADSAPEPAAQVPAKGPSPRPHPNPGLLRAYRSRRPVRGTIVGVVKGGYEVKVERSRGFCPHSQVALTREDHPETLVGQRYLFRVTQVRRGGEDVVLSRRAVLEEERADQANAVRATLVEGGVIQGHVTGIADFGAFIDLGAGVMGLAHVSELSHARIARVADAVQVGQTVQAKILKLNDRTGKISLSLRQATKDPWSDITDRYRLQACYPGTIRRIAEFGAFVELEPGVEALAPASEFPPAAAGWKSDLEVGAERSWLVLAIDPVRRRISLSPPAAPGSEVPVAPGAELAGSVQRIERYGVFVWLRPGQVGLMPAEWAGVAADTDLRRRFAVGQKIDVRVVDLGEGGRRIRLARKGVEVRVAREPPEAKRKSRSRREPEPAEPPQSFGTILGDKLRAALSDKSKS